MNSDRSMAGTGHLNVEVVCGQSAATSAWGVSPLKILIPRPRGHSVWACLSTLGGGLVAGDEIALTVHLGEGARCFLSTQASTKVYRNPNSRPCSHRLRAQLGGSSILVMIPDPVQAFAGSRYVQQQDFWLSPDSGLVLVDWLCSGRTALQERWQFCHFHSRNEVMLGGSRVLLDSLLLDPADGPLEEAYRVGRFNCLALVLVIGEPLRLASSRLLDEIGKAPIARHAALAYCASPIADGALVRLAGESVEEVALQIRRLLGFIPEILLENPWLRKW